MADNNKHNLEYFEHQSMRGLFDQMKAWQEEHGKRLLAANVERDGNMFCCIALTNPMEVVICDGAPANYQARVDDDGNLYVSVAGDGDD